MNYIISDIPYFQAPNDIFETDLTNNQKLIYLYLCRCTNNGKTAFPSYQTIANKCGMSKRNAIYCVKVLIERSFIVKQYRVKEGKNNSNLY